MNDSPNPSNNSHPQNSDRNPAKDIKDRYLYPRSRYYGEFKPNNLVFNANLQEFAQRISYICNLEMSGRISPADAYQQIKQLYKQLKKSKKELGIGAEPPKTGDSEP